MVLCYLHKTFFKVKLNKIGGMCMNTDEKKKKIIMLFIALGLILSVIFGVTFSYLAPTISNLENGHRQRIDHGKYIDELIVVVQTNRIKNA